MTVLTLPDILPEIDWTLPSLLPVGGKPNAELAWAVLDQIDLHPELWDQGHWLVKTDCGTAGCFAGWAGMLVGDKPASNSAFEAPGDPYQTTVFVEVRAMELLNIGPFVADRLFNQYNTREDLGEFVEKYFGPRP